MAKSVFEGMARGNFFIGLPEEFIVIKKPTGEWGHLYDRRATYEPDEPLVVSMIEDGWFESSAIGVIKDTETGKPVVVDGRRRHAAATEANKRIRAAYRKSDEDIDAKLIRIKALPVDRRTMVEKQAAIMIASNMLRRDYTPLERAEILGRWYDRCHDAAAVARAAGVSTATLERYLEVRGMQPYLKAAVESSTLTVADALQIHQLPAAKQAAAVRKLTDGGKRKPKAAAVREAVDREVGRRHVPSAAAMKATVANLDDILRKHQVVRSVVEDFDPTAHQDVDPMFVAGALWGIKHSRGW